MRIITSLITFLTGLFSGIFVIIGLSKNKNNTDKYTDPEIEKLLKETKRLQKIKDKVIVEDEDKLSQKIDNLNKI